MDPEEPIKEHGDGHFAETFYLDHNSDDNELLDDNMASFQQRSPQNQS